MNLFTSEKLDNIVFISLFFQGQQHRQQQIIFILFEELMLIYDLLSLAISIGNIFSQQTLRKPRSSIVKINFLIKLQKTQEIAILYLLKQLLLYIKKLIKVISNSSYYLLLFIIFIFNKLQTISNMQIFEDKLDPNSLLNWTFINQYQKANKSLFIEDFKKLLMLKPKRFQEKKDTQKMLQQKLQKVIHKGYFEGNKLLFSHRKTDNSKLFKQLLLKDQSCHKQIQKVRERILKNIRKNEEILDQQITFILPFLDYFAISNMNFDLTKAEHRSSLKNCLTCLKKMMGNLQPVSNNQKLIERNNCYKLNLDFRYIFSKAADFIANQQVKRQLLRILFESKNKKWLGIRFNRCLTSPIWTSQAIKQLMAALNKIRIQEEDIQSDMQIFEPTYKALKKNIRDMILKVTRNERRKPNNTCKKQTSIQTIDTDKIDELDQNMTPQESEIEPIQNKETDPTIKGISMLSQLYLLYSQDSYCEN